MSRMRNNTWVIFSPIVIIMKIECTVPGKTSLLEFALFTKFVTSHKRRQMGRIFMMGHFSIIFRRTISSQSYETPCIYIYIYIHILFFENSEHKLADTRDTTIRSSLDFLHLQGNECERKSVAQKSASLMGTRGTGDQPRRKRDGTRWDARKKRPPGGAGILIEDFCPD